METINFEELTPELQAYIDQERTKASKSAYANAEKKLRKDANFINDIRHAIEEEARLSGEEKLAKERELFLEEQRQFNRQRNLFQVESQLSKAGFDGEQIDKFSKFLVSEDEETTLNHVNDFLTTYRSTFEQQLAEQKKQGVPSLWLFRVTCAGNQQSHTAHPRFVTTLKRQSLMCLEAVFKAQDREEKF